jgi:hypothetical protein
MAANNQKAAKAISEMGELESGYLDGSTRSANAPQLPARRTRTLEAKTAHSQGDSSSDDLANHLEGVFAAEENTVSKPLTEKKKVTSDPGVVGAPATA